MLVSLSLTRIRRILRDTNSSVFTDTTLLKILNEVQQRFSTQTELLERVMNLSVPPIAYSTFTHRWEEDYTAKPSGLVYNFMSLYTVTQPWEPLVDGGITPTVTGGYTGTQQWEVINASLQNRLRHYWPDDFLEPVYIAYDNSPIDWIYRKEIGNVDSSFKTNSGVKPSIYIEDRETGTFFLYPRVEVNGITEISGEYGEVVYDSDTSNDSLNPSSNYGVIIIGTDMDSNFGIVVRAQTPIDALQLIYKHRPIPVTAAGQSWEWPRFVVKYIEFGVLARLFELETDLFNAILAKHFQDRYIYGLGLMARFKSKLRTGRTYKMDTVEASRRQRKLADLPSHYPSYWR